MQYSIPKSPRWTNDKSSTYFLYLENINYISTNTSKFYDLPSLKANRSTSFGYGNKIDLSKKSLITPSPLQYELKRAF